MVQWRDFNKYSTYREDSRYKKRKVKHPDVSNKGKFSVPWAEEARGESGVSRVQWAGTLEEGFSNCKGQSYYQRCWTEQGGNGEKLTLTSLSPPTFWFPAGTSHLPNSIRSKPTRMPTGTEDSSQKTVVRKGKKKKHGMDKEEGWGCGEGE